MDEARNDLRERTKSFALRAIGMFAALPRGEESRVFGRQVLRSVTPVGANYVKPCVHDRNPNLSRKSAIA